MQSVFVPLALTLVRSPLYVGPASQQLRQHGFTVLEKERLDPLLVEQCRSWCGTRLLEVLEHIGSLGCDVIEQSFSFTECEHRQRLRYDMALPLSAPIACEACDGARSWAQLCERAMCVAAPVIKAAVVKSCEPRLTMAGVVTSRPGAAQQDWHADGSAGLFTVFVPLVNIPENGDGTEFLAGSHTDVGALAKASRASGVAPAAAAGQIIIFDYRVIHRGGANPCEALGGRERPVAYIVVSANGQWDSKNFCRLSVTDALPAHIDQMPYWSDF